MVWWVAALAMAQEAACGDGLDDDADGLVDCVDPDCVLPLYELRPPPPTAAKPLAFGDLDGDGVDEVVAAHQTSGSIHVFPYDGGGMFGTEVSLELYRTIAVAALADIDGDGDLDILAGATGSEGDVAAIENLGGLTFAAPRYLSIDLPGSLDNPQVVDIDGDGDDDLMIGADGDVHVLRFEAGLVTDVERTECGMWAYAAADLDRDGDLDLYTSTAKELLSFESTATGYLPEASAGFAFAPRLARDMDGDGLVDLVGGSNTTWGWAPNVGTLAPGAFVDLGLSGCSMTVDVDVDGDGIDDWVMGHDNGTRCLGQGGLVEWIPNPGGTPGPPLTLDPVDCTDPIAVHIEGDDLACVQMQGPLRWFARSSCADLDYDSDGVSNAMEVGQGTDPLVSDAPEETADTGALPTDTSTQPAGATADTGPTLDTDTAPTDTSSATTTDTATPAPSPTDAEESGGCGCASASTSGSVSMLLLAMGALGRRSCGGPRPRPGSRLTRPTRCSGLATYHCWR